MWGIAMTDNTQLDEILEDFYDGDIRQSDMGKAKQAIFDWHNKQVEAIISERPIHHHPEHMAYMHTRELDWLKSLQMHEGVLMYNTGVILQPVSDRIQMYEDMLTRSPDTYKKVTALYGKEAEL